MLAAVVRHLVSDQVGFPVEGLGTLVALVFPLLGVGQGVRLQTAAHAQTTRHLGHMSVSQANLLRRPSLTSGRRGTPGRTPYTRGDRGTCGGVAGLGLPGPSGHRPLLDTRERPKNVAVNCRKYDNLLGFGL